MNKLGKKLLACVAACSIVLAAGSHMQAFADTDSFNGTTVSYSVTTNSTSATAVTSFSKKAREIAVQATVYYVRDSATYKRNSGWKTATIGGVSATASVKGSNALVIGGKGDHRIISEQGTTWTGTSSVGTVDEGALAE
ncbi:MAG: hypothetical protein NC180_07225 [Muribaculaceae bacterium]|nr:hypothetical protein [Roseburia sp.]MCM1429978.1 hypothetical protein [Muribaculaceae bacterium]MCM1492995.1 hypothetical protein [Muribaculaceae bacterium]